MPVSTTSYKAGTILETAVLCSQHGLSYFKRIENTLHELKGGSQDQQTCSVEMMRKLITTIQEQLPCQRFWQVEVMVLVIKHIATDTDSAGLSVLLDNGLTEILEFVFEETRRHVSHNGEVTQQEADHLMEILFETINDVAEYSGPARKLTVEVFCARLIKFVIDTRIFFHTRMEAERTLNLLLEGCEDDDLAWISKDPVLAKLMQHLAEFLPGAGDFEMQIAITESLARMVTKSERKRRSPLWFPSNIISDAFLDIDDQQFDSDCRTFLNLMNEICPDRSVYSFSCKKAFMGNFELRNPSEDNSNNFWVDFNSISQSISLYVADEDTATEQDGGLWETVAFAKDKVKDFIVNEDNTGCIALVMTLTQPASSLLAFCGSDSHSATIVFPPTTDLGDALAVSIGLEKNAAPIETPSSSSRRSSVSKINVLVNRARNTSWGLSNMPQSFNDGYVDGGPNHEVHLGKAARSAGIPLVNEAKATPLRRKMSIPLVPMSTPTMTSLHSATSSAATTPMGFTQPRTPTTQHGSTKKVKTPLQITVADKPTASGTDSDADVARNQSTTSVKVSVTRNTVICKSPLVQTECEEGAPNLVPDSEGVPDANVLKQGAVSKKKSKGKRATSEEDDNLADYGKISSESKPAKENIKERKESKKVANKRLSKKSSKEETLVDNSVKAHPNQQSQDVTAIPDTQSQTSAGQESGASQETCQPKGKKKGGKAAAKPPSQATRRSTRSSKASQNNALPEPLKPESKSKRGKKFSLYSETSMMESPKSKDKLDGGKGKKQHKGNDVASGDSRTAKEHPSSTVTASERRKSRGKGKQQAKGDDVSSDISMTVEEQTSTEVSFETKAAIRKNEKKEDQGNPLGADKEICKPDNQNEDGTIKQKGAKKKGKNQITGSLLIEDNLSQDFVVPRMTAKGKPTHGVKDHAEDGKISGDLMYNHDPQEEEGPSHLPEVDERAAAKALQAENEEYCVPSSAPEEMCSSSQQKDEVIPDSQPRKSFFRRSGRFPSPLLSDITEESTLSRSSSGPNMGKQLTSPVTSSKSDGTSGLMVIKSKAKPQTAKADSSTSRNHEDKDPYDFVDSSTVSSLPVISRKSPKAMSDGGGDADSAKSAKKQDKKTTRGRRDKGRQAANKDAGLGGDSQDEFVSNSLTFGVKGKGSLMTGSKECKKKQQSTKRTRESPDADCNTETTEGEESDVLAQEKPHQSTRRKMKGKLDSDSDYVQRIQREAKESADFANRMQNEDDQYPDIEVARDVAHVTEAYKDTDISAFVQSVMKSLPKHKLEQEKNIHKNRAHETKRSASRMDKTMDQSEDEDAQLLKVEDVGEKRSHCRRSSREAKKMSHKSSSKSEQEREPDQVEPKPQMTHGKESSKKDSFRQQKDKSSRKFTEKSKRSVKGDESLTESEMSTDDLLNAHMDSILGNRRLDSSTKSASKDADKKKLKEKRSASSAQEFEVDEDVLRHAEDSISRRSRMIAAIEHSSVELSDGPDKYIAKNTDKEKASKKRSIEKEVSIHADPHKKAKRSSTSNQSPGHASPEVQSTKKHNEKQAKQHKGTRLDRSSEEDLYEFQEDLEDILASTKKNRKDSSRQEQKGSASKKIKTAYLETSTDELSLHSKKNRSFGSPAMQIDSYDARSESKSLHAAGDKMERSEVKPKVSRRDKTHFGSQIEDSDTEEIMETETTTAPDDTSTVVSMESFSNMCKDLLKSSKRGIAVGRGRRKVQRVDYTELENSYSSEEESMLQSPTTSIKKVSTKKQPIDISQHLEETSSCHSTSVISDAVSELSWLVDKPKQMVSTYSKTRTAVFGVTKITKNLDTVTKPKNKSHVQNVNAPKKRKSQSSRDKDEDDEVPLLYYYSDEDRGTSKQKKQRQIEARRKDQSEGDQVSDHHEPVLKKAKSSCRRSLVECMSGAITSMYDSSQDMRDDDGDNNDDRADKDASEEEDLVAEEDEERIPTTPALTVETVASQMSTWTTPGSGILTPGSSNRTPKQVSFVDDLESFGSDVEDHTELEFPVSGPSKTIKPSESTLKRKYANLISEADFEDDDADQDEDESDHNPTVPTSKQSKIPKQNSLNHSIRQPYLEPKVLFKDAEPTDEPMLSEHSGEDGISDHSISSSWGHNMDFPAMQMPEMFGFMKNRIKQKMMAKKNQTKQFTETAIQSTQKQMNKLFLQLHKARQKSQNDFQHKLLTELVGMESNLEKLTQIQAQNDHIMKQYAKKSTKCLDHHLSNVEKIHTAFLEKGASLGNGVMESIEQIINKEIKSMLKKMLQDVQQEQVKKTMQSLFLLR